ncbi:hypothetical protein [Primorskyibacter sp. S87]|uniref:hypothetical protein n=1 Tax=Primorskyibacter sp. S87 TaxID=3415126 RepID=UPI003C79F4B0
MAHVITTAPVTFNLLARVRAAYDAFRASRARRASFDQAFGELQSLSDDELKEFGYHRSDLMDLARSAIR